MLGTLLVAVLVAGQPSVDSQLGEVRKLIKLKQWSEAAKVTREASARIEQQAPLEVFDGRALAAPADGLGLYNALPDGKVRKEELYLYAQVRNHGLRQIDEWYELHLVSDLIVLDAEGTELARDMSFGTSRFNARAAHRDTFVNIALRVTGLLPGKYRIKLVVHDKIGGKQGSVEIPFEMP